jgi:hypothetical protein
VSLTPPTFPARNLSRSGARKKKGGGMTAQKEGRGDDAPALFPPFLFFFDRSQSKKMGNWITPLPLFFWFSARRAPLFGGFSF